MFLLDPNLVSELRKAPSGRANPGVVAWAATAPPEGLFLSALSVLELELGILLKERRDPDQGRRLRAWLEHKVLPGFNERILPVDTAVARRCAALHVPDPRSERDALIAATALVHRLTLVTRDNRDFEAIGVPLVNPFDAPSP